ncbi:hypothetical protein J27TS7_01400 [Paenibacillus dendritiformis]|nr:hypothetical protein J27TS7_01400 [Paenibacillus dendritiformis]
MVEQMTRVAGEYADEMILYDEDEADHFPHTEETIERVFADL